MDIRRNGRYERGCKRGRRGTALIEMAFILPVLILLFLGVIEIARYTMTLNRVAGVANKLAGVLYNLTPTEAGDITAVDRILDEIPTLSAPGLAPTITVRFCDWESNGKPDAELNRVNLQYRAGQGGSGCYRVGPQCSEGATYEGHGTFVQVYACLTFDPVITSGIFHIFDKTLTVESLSYLPMTNTNLTKQLVALPGGGRVPEAANCSTNPDLCLRNGGSAGGGTAPMQNNCQNPPTCDYTKQNFDADSCQCVNACPRTTEEKYQGNCSTSCLSGYERDAGTGQCQCPPGMIADGKLGCGCPNAGDEVVGTACQPKCAADEERVGQDCLKQCKATDERVNGVCETKCADGTERVNGACRQKCAACEYRSPQTLTCAPQPNCTQ